MNEPSMVAPQPPPVSRETYHYLQQLFSYQVLTIRQKLLTLSEKYHVDDEQGRPRFFVVRPPRLTLSALAGFAAIAVNIIFLIYAYRLFVYAGQPFAAFVVAVVGGNLAGIIRLLLAPYRDISVYSDDTEQFPVLFISQDNKFGMNHWFTIHDAVGQPVARARRPFFRAIWRKVWLGENMDGRPICTVREDSFWLALLRRYFGPMYGLLRTNFDVEYPDGRRIGEYNRKLTLTDQYILDLRGDQDMLVDRRVMLALAILLDTGERR